MRQPKQPPAISKEAAKACDEAIDAMLAAYPDLHGALVSTADGHVVATRLPQGWERGDVAAMASSMTALAESVSQRTALSRCRNVIIEGEGGHITLLKVDRALTLTAVGKPTMNLGLQLSACRSCAEQICRSMDAQADGVASSTGSTRAHR
ncbi:MAG TPA: roadblock/LC7 domain-containing protein [Gammaproteobacteria bacterium]|nr:roadblock/LC7 domain-containing protein [Gammaproteobacteria bacterium]